jgi:hypothetical protein
MDLYFPAAEDLVFIAARTLGTTQAADQQNRDSGGNNQRQKASTRHEPM